jgi:hypothetical protein
MSEVNEKAKYIFLIHMGNGENMQENNCLEEYEQFNISRDAEANWKNEFLHEQFTKVDTKTIPVAQLIGSVCSAIDTFKDYSDYKKLLSVKTKYLREADIFEQMLYFQKAFNSLIAILDSDNTMSAPAKLDILCEFEDMLTETINQESRLPDKILEKLTNKYGLESKPNHTITKLIGIHNSVKSIKEIILDCE